MKMEWQNFLKEQGAIFNENNVLENFGNPELEHFLIKHGPVLSDLSQLALIEVSGEDAFTFLQGQFSNDLKSVTPEQGQLTAYCEPQGKVLALMTVFTYQNAFYLNFDGSLKDKIMQRLTMFKMRSKVNLKDMSEEWIQIGYAGEFANLDLQRSLSLKIKDLYQVAQIEQGEFEGIIAIKQPGPYHRYSLFGKLDVIQHAWKTLSGNSERIGSADWALLNIASGQPEVTLKTTEQFVAQFINLDKLEAINFKKGCFPGQEIIARMHYRGKATKRMLRIHFNKELALEAGEEFQLNDSEDRTYKFTVISAGKDIYEGTLVLAVTTTKSLENAKGDLTTTSGALATIEPLPYDLTEE